MNTISIQVPSIAENIRMIESFIDNAKERFDLDDDIYGNIMIAVTEAVNNAIKHGNSGDKKKNVYLSLSLDESLIKFVVKDEGGGFDFQGSLRKEYMGGTPDKYSPIGLDVIKRMAEQGRIRASDYLCPVDGNAWVLSKEDSVLGRLGTLSSSDVTEHSRTRHLTHGAC